MTKRTRPPEITLAIDTLAESRHIGSIALHEVNGEDRKATLGVMIGDKDYWSRGYGTDAIVTLLRFGFDEMNLNRVDLSVDEDNVRGITCYRKCGFVEEGRLRQARYRNGRYLDALIMAVLADEFRALHGDGEHFF
jgi:RimJ/RimL family protein N-acetyltransferase